MVGIMILELCLLLLHFQNKNRVDGFTPAPQLFGQRQVRPFSGQTQQFARTPFITGNWKLNPTTRQEAVQLASEIAQSITPSSHGDVALFVPYPFIECVQNAVGDKISVGAEVRIGIRP